MKLPLFSVIVPTYGRPELLRQAIGSVLDQTVPDLECIVVQDAGPGSPEVPSDPRVRVIQRERRGGAAAARNSGLAEARGRYVTFLDDDDLFAVDRLAIALEGLAEAPIALCWRGSPPEDTGVTTWSLRLQGDLRASILQAPVPHVGQVALDLKCAPYFDERFRVSEDVEWWVRAAKVGDAVTIERVGYLLRHHQGERQTDRLSDRLACRLLLLETHADYFASNRKAASYQWRRAGGFAHALGARRLRREAFSRSFALAPGLGSFAHLARACWPLRVGRKDPNYGTVSHL